MQPILFASPDNPVPENHIAGTFRSFDGLELRYAIFRSGSNVPRGTVVLFGGRNECTEKYFETIRNLNAMGLWVATFDWRGQGGSPRLLPDRRRGHIGRFADYEHDLEMFLEHVVLPDAKLPFFVIAHSMGSLIALSAAPNLSNRIERMVLLAPFVGIAGQGPTMCKVRLLSGLATTFGFGRMQFASDVLFRPFEANLVTSDRRRYLRNQSIIRTRPELGIGPPTASWIGEMIRAIDRVQDMQHLGKIRVPTLLLAPTLDRIVPYGAMEELSRKFRAAKLIPITGSGHEILQERDIFRAQALAAIEAFIPGSDAVPMVFNGD